MIIRTGSDSDQAVGKLLHGAYMDRHAVLIRAFSRLGTVKLLRVRMIDDPEYDLTFACKRHRHHALAVVMDQIGRSVNRIYDPHPA